MQGGGCGARVFRSADGRDRRPEWGACGEQLAGPLGVHTADSNHRNAHRAARLLQPGHADDGIRVLLATGREDRTEGDVVGAGAQGSFYLWGIVCGETDDPVGPEQFTRDGDREIVLTQVDTICIHETGDVGAIVDDEPCAVPPCPFP